MARDRQTSGCNGSTDTRGAGARNLFGPLVDIRIGDALSTLRDMASRSVHCIVTSPPYFGLRDYGHTDQIGHESTPADYVARLVDVFRESRRVLRDDGTLWLNLGDSYAANGARSLGRNDAGRNFTGGGGNTPGSGNPGKQGQIVSACDLATKQPIGIPWRVAFALQADGWYLRQDIIWHKPNPMPESVRDRCTKAHEYIFMFSKSPRYYFDADAIKEPAIYNGKRDSVRQREFRGKGPIPGSGQSSFRAITEFRNRRSVWTVSTKPYKGAHFATFPPDLIEPCILAGSPRGGVVLDPFGGSGTTGAVALRHDREAVLIEINPDYLPLIRERCGL